MTKKIGEKNTTFFSFWNISYISISLYLLSTVEKHVKERQLESVFGLLFGLPKWVQPTWTLVSVAIAWTRRCTGTCFATICRFGIIAFPFPSLPTSTTTLRTFTPRAPIAPVSINYKKKMDGRDIIKTSFIFQQFVLDKHWIFDAYFCYIALPLTLLWLIQPTFLTFTNTTSSLALEILERGIIAITLFLVVFAFLCAESIAV